MSATAAPRSRIDGASEEIPAAKILVVDDQPDNLLSAEAVLEGLGQTIFKASSGAEALLRVLDHDFAVIILDIMMPRMDGFEAAALIRQRRRSRHTPIIFLTALGRSEEHMRHGYSLGAVDYLAKPFDPDILRAKVSVFVELSRKTELLRRQSEILEQRNQELAHAVERSRRAEAEIAALNSRLEAQVRQLAEVNHELEAFNYSVSHDLRGPLSRIAGFSRALLELQEAQLSDKARLYLERIDHSARRTCDLVEALLNLARVTRAPMNETAVDLSACARGIAAELSAQEPERRVSWVIADSVQARGDPKLLETALCNLMENAWKFTRKHSSARIEFGGRSNGRGTVYFVADDGAGFDMTNTDGLFRPFRRLHDASEFEGAGIGLATVDRIVRRHGGRIWAESCVEGGAVFHFTLSGEVE